MPTPTADVMTGDVTNGPIDVGEQFAWTCNGHGLPSGTSITVHAAVMGDGQPWFQDGGQQGEITFQTPNESGLVTAMGASPFPGWMWTASGVNVNANAHVVVEASMPQEKKKAS